MGSLNIFESPWVRPRLLFPKFFMGFCSDRSYECACKKVRSFTRSWDNKGYFKTLGSRWIRRSRSSKVTDFGTKRKRVYDFLLVRHRNLGPILHRFGDIAGFLCSWPHSYSTPFLGCSAAQLKIPCSAGNCTPYQWVELFRQTIQHNNNTKRLADKNELPMIVHDTVSFAVHVDSKWFTIKTESTHTTSEAARMIRLTVSLQYLTTHIQSNNIYKLILMIKKII